MTNGIFSESRIFLLQNKIDMKKFVISLVVITMLLYVTFLSLGIFKLIIIPLIISTFLHWILLPYAKGLFKKEFKNGI